MRKLDILTVTLSYLLILSFCTSCKNAINASNTNDIVSLQERSIFPEDWFGNWEGSLQIFRTNGILQELPMSLAIGPHNADSRYTWTMTYKKDSINDIRAYELYKVDEQNNHYQIDEKNTIVIDAYMINKELISVFEVMGNMLKVSYGFENDHIIFKTVMFKSEHISTTGDTLYKGDCIPEVISYPIVVSQKAILNRMRE